VPFVAKPSSLPLLLSTSPTSSHPFSLRLPIINRCSWFFLRYDSKLCSRQLCLEALGLDDIMKK
jgi:hypothetical protein